MIAAGYEDGNDADSLRSDPMFKMALDLTPSDRELCSQPTISRLENLPDARALLRMGRAMVDLYCESYSKVPKRIVLDIDDTFDAVHGGQQLRLFNAHYDEYGFQATRKAMQDSADPLSQQAHMYFHTFLRVAKYQGSDQALMELARD